MQPSPSLKVEPLWLRPETPVAALHIGENNFQGTIFVMIVSLLLSCPKVRFEHVGCASGCVSKTVPINIQAAEVLTSEASSENVRFIDVLTFFSHDNMVKNNKVIPLSL